MIKLLSVFIASLLVLTGLSFSSINQGNTASAKTKYYLLLVNLVKMVMLKHPRLFIKPLILD